MDGVRLLGHDGEGVGEETTGEFTDHEQAAEGTSHQQLAASP